MPTAICNTLKSLTMILATLWFSGISFAQQSSATSKSSASNSSPKVPEAEAAIRAEAKAFVDAFNRHDAEAIAARWTENAVYTDEDGQQTIGREKIQSEYAMLFQEQSDLQMSNQVDSIRMLGPDTAIEEGRTALTPQPVGEPRVMSSYTAVHVKQDGKWRMADLRDTRIVMPPDYGSLADLSFLVGSWTAQADDAKIDLQFQWMAGNRFLVRNHSGTNADKLAVSGVEVIGVNPTTSQVTSWIFTSDGSHSVGLWAPTDSGWIIEYEGVTADGTPTMATNHLMRSSDEKYSWRSENRVVGTNRLPNTPEIELKRGKK